MKLDKMRHKPLNRNNIVQPKTMIKDIDDNYISMDEPFINYDILKSAYEGLKASIEDSYARQLPINKEYLLNCIDYWMGEPFLDDKGESS